MKWNKIILFVLLALIFVACGPDKDKVRIVGDFEKLNYADFFLFSENENWDGIDTIRVRDGEFDFTRPLKKTTIVTLLYPNFYKQNIIAVPGKKITIKGSANNLRDAKVEGSDENHELTAFRMHILNKSLDEQKMAAIDYIEQNPESVVSEVLFRDYFLEVPQYEDENIMPLLRLLIKNQPHNIGLQAVQFRLKPMCSVIEGSSFPEMEFITLRHDTLSTKDFKGEPFLVSFWATWHRKSLDPISNLTDIYTAYKGKIKMLSISLDIDSTFCHSKVVRDSVPGYCVCDGKGWNSHYVHSLGLRYLPGNILVDKDGVIVSRDIPWNELKNKIDKLLK